MKTSVGWWDAIFGERMKLQLPDPTGGVREVEVTKRWLEKMQQEGKISEVDRSSVQVHVLDPGGAARAMLARDFMLDPSDLGMPEDTSTDTYRVETWEVGVDVSEESYRKFLDPESQALYALVRQEDGEPQTFLTAKSLWMKTKEMMGE